MDKQEVICLDEDSSNSTVSKNIHFDLLANSNVSVSKQRNASSPEILILSSDDESKIEIHSIQSLARKSIFSPTNQSNKRSRTAQKNSMDKINDEYEISSDSDESLLNFSLFGSNDNKIAKKKANDSRDCLKKITRGDCHTSSSTNDTTQIHALHKKISSQQQSPISQIIKKQQALPSISKESISQYSLSLSSEEELEIIDNKKTSTEKHNSIVKVKEILILSSSDEENNEEYTPRKYSPMHTSNVKARRQKVDEENNEEYTPRNYSPMHTSNVKARRQKVSNKSRKEENDMWSPVSIDPNTMNFSDLKSPFATSPLASNINQNTLPTYASIPLQPTKIPVPPLPSLYQVGGKLYPDLRHEFVRALHVHALRNRHAAHQRCTFDATIRAIIVLSLRETPIRTPYTLARMKGIGIELLKVVQDAEKQCRKKTPYIPPNNKFSAVAPAALVALLQYEKHNQHIMNQDKACCSAEALLKRVESLVHFRRRGGFDEPIQYYLDKDNLDPDWGQIKKLCGSNVHADLEPFIKQRSRKGNSTSGIVFELLPRGREVAMRLEKLLHAAPPPLYGPLRQLASTTTDPEFEGVTMCVDFREGGGGSNSLHKMCNLLDEHCVPYVVRELKISDYIFFVGNKLAPILIERKNVDDVASSLSDGRWERQQRNMRRAQFVLGGGEARKCQICYLIEGDVSRRTVHGGNVGRRSWDQSVENVESAIADLPKLGFSIMTSRSHMGSMKILAKIASDVSWKAKNNSIDCSLTYDEFLLKMKQCDEGKGDPPASSEHQYPAAPIVTPSLYGSPTISRGSRNSPSHPLSTPINCSGDRSNETQIENEEISGLNNMNSNENNPEFETLKQLSLAELKRRCKERDEKQSGTKMEIINRLLKPRKPEILILRSRRGQYVPKTPSCNAALMIALLLNHEPGSPGLTKENLMLLAEETGVSKDPMDGNGGFYDGWSGMKDLTQGDPALVFVAKKKYSLTTQPTGSAGVDVAKALHVLAHRESLCRCNNYVPT